MVMPHRACAQLPLRPQGPNWGAHPDPGGGKAAPVSQGQFGQTVAGSSLEHCCMIGEPLILCPEPKSLTEGPLWPPNVIGQQVGLAPVQPRPGVEQVQDVVDEHDRVIVPVHDPLVLASCRTEMVMSLALSRYQPEPMWRCIGKSALPSMPVAMSSNLAVMGTMLNVFAGLCRAADTPPADQACVQPGLWMRARRYQTSVTAAHTP